MPHRPIGKRQPAISPSQLAALWFRDSRERRLAGAQHPLPNSPSNKVFPGVQAGCDWRLPSSGRSYHSLLLHWPNRQDWRGLCGRSQPRPARVWPQDAWRVVVLGSEAAAVKNLDGGTFQGGSNVPHGLVRGEDVIRGVTPPETETVLGEGA